MKKPQKIEVPVEYLESLQTAKTPGERQIAAMKLQVQMLKHGMGGREQSLWEKTKARMPGRRWLVPLALGAGFGAAHIPFSGMGNTMKDIGSVLWSTPVGGVAAAAGGGLYLEHKARTSSIDDRKVQLKIRDLENRIRAYEKAEAKARNKGKSEEAPPPAYDGGGFAMGVGMPPPPPSKV